MDQNMKQKMGSKVDRRTFIKTSALQVWQPQPLGSLTSFEARKLPMRLRLVSFIR